MTEDMKKIAHRGNISGKQIELENKPSYIESALFKKYDVEVDVWYLKDKLLLGHDEPQYEISLSFLEQYQEEFRCVI